MTGFELSLLSASFVTFFVVIDPIGVAPIFAALAVAFANAVPLSNRQSYDISPVIGQVLVEEGEIQADA